MVENNYEQMERKRILKPTNDVVFQALFGRGRENITKAMLEDILKIKIHKIDLDKNKDLFNDRKDQKNGRVDVRAVINDNIECDIEIQLVTHEMMLERFLYYWAKMCATNLKIGSEYSKLRKTISIIIVGEEIEQFNDIPKAHTKWQLREEEHRDIVLTENCEMNIIELPKAIQEYQNNKQDEMLQWMMFLENPENEEVLKIMEENKDIKAAKEELDKINQDEILWKEALDIEITRMDHAQFMYEAKRDGKKEGKLEDAKKMLEKGMDIETIVEITGLSKEEIQNLNN